MNNLLCCSKYFSNVLYSLSNVYKVDEYVLEILTKVDRLHLKDLFAQEKVSIADFVYLNDDDLKDIGIENPEQRKHIRRGSRKFVEHIKNKGKQGNKEDRQLNGNELKSKCVSVTCILI